MQIGMVLIGFLRLVAPEQLHRHGEAVVDHHLLARADVEVVGDDAVDDPPGELRIALELADRRNAPALVLVLVFERGADGEGRHLVEEEVEAVVVVEDDRDVGLLLGEPFVDRRIALEERLPVRVLELLLGDGVADGGNVRGGQASDDARHGVILPAS